MSEITVTPWLSDKPLPQDPTAPLHDCLWDIAHEQAVLARMKHTGEDWKTAAAQVTDRDIRTHLDTVCDDNGFRRLDGSGRGRDPNLISDGERIRVRIDPRQLNEPAPGVTNNQPSQGAYNKAVGNDTGGVDLNKKEQVDNWLGGIPGFEKLSDPVKTALLEAYNAGADRQELANFANSAVFTATSVTDRQRVQLLKVYGAQDQGVARGEIARLTGQPANEQTLARLGLIATEGFARLNPDQQRAFLDRYGKDNEFRAAIDKIIIQDNFKDKGDMAQAHALDILRRYSGRKKDGYGAQDTKYRTEILVKLYDDVLSSSDYKLNEVTSTQENSHQSDLIKTYAEKTVPKMTAPPPSGKGRGVGSHRSPN